MNNYISYETHILHERVIEAYKLYAKAVFTTILKSLADHKLTDLSTSDLYFKVLLRK